MKKKNTPKPCLRLRNNAAIKKRSAHQTDELNVSRYRSNLELLIQQASADYNFLITDLRDFQSSYIRTYLWISTILIAFNTSLYLKILDKTHPIPLLNGAPSVAFYLLALLSLLIPLVVFVIGVDAMRGRKDTLIPIGDYNEKMDQLWAERDKGYEGVLRSILGCYQDCIDFENKERSDVGNCLKGISWLLISTVLITIITVCSYMANPTETDSSLLRQREVITMSNENKPAPPPPPPTTTPANVSTHTAKPPKPSTPPPTSQK